MFSTSGMLKCLSKSILIHNLLNDFREEKAGKFLKFQLNSYFESNGGLQYIGIIGKNIGGFASELLIVTS